jgi:hypothetical protein
MTAGRERRAGPSDRRPIESRCHVVVLRLWVVCAAGKSTPLSFLALFRRGGRMRTLAAVQLLSDLSETSGRTDRGAAALVEL